MRSIRRAVTSRVRVTVAAALGIAVLAVAACGSSGTSSQAGNEKVMISFDWWGATARAKVTQAAVNAFEKLHPNIQVQTQYVGSFSTYWQKIATEEAGGSAPDVIQMDYRYLREYANRGQLLDLAQYKPALPTSGMPTALAKSGQMAGKLYAVPFGAATLAVFYDATLLSKLGVPDPQDGWSLSQFQQWAHQVYTKSHGKVYGIGDPAWSEDVLQLWLRQHGKALYNADGKFGFSKNDLEQFWNFWKSMEHSGDATPAPITAQIDGTPENSPLIKHQAAADFNFDSLFSSYTAATSDHLGIVDFPTGTGTLGQYAKPSMLLSISRQSAHPAQAAELVNYLVNSPAAGAILGVSRGLPPNLTVRSAIKSSLGASDQMVVAYEAAVAAKLGATPAAPPPGDVQVQPLVQSIYQSVAAGQASVAQGASQFFSEGTSDLASAGS